MIFNPIKFAEKLKDDIIIDYIGKKPKIYKNLINKLNSSKGDDYTDKLDEFIRFKGPYIQSLPIPKWSDQNWQEFASNIKLYPEIIDVFSELGIEKLYSFQEEAIKSIINGIKELLVVASTGRGKTESWLIPILNDILKIKMGEIPGKKKSVKALLIYPTKALSQDQFKRIVNILIKLNPNFPIDQRITIGIYDGDTPYKGDRDAERYLFHAFRYFECPIINLEQDKCKKCGQRLKNIKGFKSYEGKERDYITVPDNTCQHKCNLDFIYLTREDIIENKVDIILTNPDTINYKLFNINADIERQIFVLDPKYIVIDEIHIYSGIFGAFTSLLLKRYKTMRKYHRGDTDDLRIIAASATVQNKLDLFSKISGSFEPIVIEEKFKEVKTDKKKIDQKIPEILLNDYISDERSLVSIFLKENIIKFGEHFKSITESKLKNDEEKIEILQNYLYNYFIKGLNKSNNEVYFKLLQLIFYILKSGVETVNGLKSKIRENIIEDLSKKQLDILFYNLYLIGCFSGIIENRIHLFSWPLDGYYGCINCGIIFASKLDNCPKCKENFITSIVICSYCGEQFFESWFCPECFHLFPSNVNNEGISSYYEDMKCNGGNLHEEEIECLKIIWKPSFKCNHCGKVIERNDLPRCRNNTCESNILEFIPKDNTYICDICSEIYSIHDVTDIYEHCPSCNSSNLYMMNKNQNQKEDWQCFKCGSTEKIFAEQQKCQCGGSITPYRKVPWICLNCGKKYFTLPTPLKCEGNDCNSRSFALNGIFDIPSEYKCKKCKKSNKKYIKSNGCGISEHRDQIFNIKPAYKHFKVIYQDYSIRKIERKNSLAFYNGKCYHPRKSQIRERRFDGLYYTPLHTAVTSSAFLLRYFIDPNNKSSLKNSLKESKLLCFSDSISEMEEIAENFREPEYELFIDKLVYNEIDSNSKIKLNEIQNNVYDEICSYFKIIFDLKRSEEIPDKVAKEFSRILKVRQNQIIDKIFKDVYNRFIKIKSPRNFIHEGIANFEIEDFSTLSNPEQKIIKDILNSYKTPWLDILAEIQEEKKEKQKLEAQLVGEDTDNSTKAQITIRLNELETKMGGKKEATRKILDNLQQNNYIREEFHKFYINAKRVLCFKVDKDHPILFEPFNNEFHSNYSKTKVSTIKFNVPPESRIDINRQRFFSRNIYRILTFPKLFLISEIYRGGTRAFIRRQIEYNFKTSPEINFLSTGPAMEIGIDIGDLNMLLLYGTPPNINSYLQRIGRAGRKAKKSLILSVSKRNPIDYFYFNNTLDLIQSESQPVPLNVLNSEIIQISLTWAVLDFISINYNIFWKKNDETDNFMYDGFDQKEDINKFVKNDYKKFTSLLYAPINTLVTSLRQIQAFDILKQIVSKDIEEIKAYLNQIMDFDFCSRCGKIYLRTKKIQNCIIEKCNGRIIKVEEYLEDEVFNSILKNFPERMLFYYLGFDSDLRRKIRGIGRKRDEIEDKIDTTPGKEQELYNQLRKVEQEHTTLVNIKNDISKMKFTDFMKKTIMKKYFFNLRNIDDDVEIYSNNASRDGTLRRSLTDTRNLSLALKDYHPYAKVKVQTQDHFVVRIEEDLLKKEQLNNLINDIFKKKLFCFNCNKIVTAVSKICDYCGLTLLPVYNFIPKSVDVLFRGTPLNFEEVDANKIFADDLFPLTNRRNPKINVRKTYCSDASFIYYFEPEKGIALKNNNSDDVLIELKLGKLGICYYSEKFNVSYSNGIFDRKERFFIICDHDGCNSILDQTNFECPKNKTHSKRKYIRLLRDFHSRGIEISIKEANDKNVAHTLSHGLKLALQKIAGVDIRTIGESEGTGGEPYIYIFDSVLGGNGICETLFYLVDGEYKNLKEAIKVIQSSYKSCCNTGCPHCIYQYGCYLHNNPIYFDKKQLLKILDIPYTLIDISHEE